MQNQTTLLPLPEDLPDFSQALTDLERVPRVLYECLEQAAAKIAAFREAECPLEYLDDGLSASLLRFQATRSLKHKGLDAEFEEAEWSLDWLPFMGISFHYNGYHVRVLKGSDGCLPGCGTSERKIKFYNQVTTMYLVGTTPRKTRANLICLWDLNPSYGLSGLWLALPAVGGARAESVSAYWCKPLPHPSEELRVTPPTPEDDLEELIVRLDDKQETGSANER